MLLHKIINSIKNNDTRVKSEFLILLLLLIVFVIFLTIELKSKWFWNAGWWVAIGTISLGIVAIFQDKIRDFWHRPRLNLDFIIEPPNCHKTILNYIKNEVVIDRAFCCYYRLKITNFGEGSAKEVEVMIVNKYIKQQNGLFIEDNSFLPLNLLWSHYGKVVMENIPPSLFKHCDFGRIVEPQYRDREIGGLVEIDSGIKTVLNLDLAQKPNTGSHIVLPGTYRFKITVASSNTKPITKVFELEYNDFWDNNEKEMLEEAIRVKEIQK